MVPRFPVYLFDVDGTLMDSALDICGAIQYVIETDETSPKKDVSFAYLRTYIGRHLMDLFTDLGYPPEVHEALLQRYRQKYLSAGHTQTRVFPGVAEMLAVLGGRKSTATTKGTPTTRAVLEQFCLIQHFDHVQGTDGFPAKPDPDVILASIRALGAQKEDCLMVGDSAADMEAARRAGVRSCAVRWGYGNWEAMARWSPDFWIDEPGQLTANNF